MAAQTLPELSFAPEETKLSLRDPVTGETVEDSTTPKTDSNPTPTGTTPPHSGRRSDSLERTRSYRTKDGRSQPRKPILRGSYTSEYEAPPMSARTMRSPRSHQPLRWNEREEWDDEDYWYERERERDYWREQDEYIYPQDKFTRRPVTRSRPPPSWANRASFDMPDTSHSRPSYIKEPTPSQRNVRIRDEEMGFDNAGRLDWKALTAEEKAEVLRLPWTHWMNSDFKNHFVASLGEFIGTTLFLLFAFAGTEVANTNSQASGSSSSDSNTTTGSATGFNVSVLLYISLIFGFSLMVNVWVFFRISGGLFNPAVTFAMALVRAIPPVRALCLFVAQMLGSMLASVIVRFLFPDSFNVRTTISGVSVVQGLLIEALLTAELVFTIFMLAKEKHKATFIAPVGIGLALFIAEMVGVQFTGGSLNPARSFGPCVVTLTFDSEHWIYWVGPLLGALIAVVFYRFIKTLEYEMANPGADGDPSNDPTVNPEKRDEIRRTRSHSVA
ncbi:aquaporin-like protein [Xylariales sp. PMI_506]|nr:aquaporin-like protein [Xylariales sp. PMI_506]